MNTGPPPATMEFINAHEAAKALAKEILGAEWKALSQPDRLLRDLSSKRTRGTRR